jgi:integrase
MAKSINKLKSRTILNLSTPGLHGDGNGLYLRVTQTGSRSWMFRYMIAGRARTMGLGAARVISLANARHRALDLQRLIQGGIDPLIQQQLSASAAENEKVTFQSCAQAYVAAHEPSWRNQKHIAQWRATLETYCFPKIGQKAVAVITTDDVLSILEPIWTLKPETAGRVRGRIENILDWATVKKHRAGDNPARWRGHLDKLLPAKSKVRRVKHHAALPYGDVGQFFAQLRQQDACGARALAFCILTATRTSETIGARWDEIDWERAIWTIPGERMKAGRSHRVPVSADALAVLKQMQPPFGPYVFPGAKEGEPLSNMAMTKCLSRMGRTDITVHGFRSTFRDWAAETTSHPNEVVEMALAHTIKNAAEAAYRRGDMLDRRQRLMSDWAKSIVDTSKSLL